MITPMNQLSSEGSNLVRMQIHSDKVRIIDAVCINCNKRFKSMRAVSMHLKMTAARHTVNFINYGNYDKKTGLRELNRPRLEFRSTWTHYGARCGEISLLLFLQ